MKVLVFGGAGKMGSAVAWDLVQQEDVEAVGLVGRRKEALEEARRWLNSPKVVVHPLDIMDRAKTVKLMRQYTVGVNALPDRRTSYKVLEAALEAGFSLVDMLEEYHRRPDPYEVEGLELPQGMRLEEYGEWLHRRAMENGVTFLDGIGFAPGLSNITVGEGIRKLDRAETAVARVGGIPSKEAAAKHPLRYMITWAFWHVLREYMVKLNVQKGGKPVEVEALTDRERFKFRKFGNDEELVCAVTPGMPSFLYTRPQLREFAEKTIRWPGHFEGIDTLKECGLLDLEPVEFQGKKIVPRDFLLALLEPRLQPRPGETDICVMWNTVTGTKGGEKLRIDYYMWDEADPQSGISSMGRVTGFPSAIGALFIGRGLIKERGLVPPEDCIMGESYRLFIEELKKRGIEILETVE